jgi:hypothetical protein
MGIHGIPIELAVKVQTGTDSFNRPVYDTEWVTVDNVLIGQPSTEEVTDELNLSGKRLDYLLGIPKGDTHDWEDTQVRFWGQVYQTIGAPTQGIESMIPLSWNKKVKVMRYEQS